MPAGLVALEDPSERGVEIADHRGVSVLRQRGRTPETLTVCGRGRVNRLGERPVRSRPVVGICEPGPLDGAVVAVRAPGEDGRAIAGKAHEVRIDPSAL